MIKHVFVFLERNVCKNVNCHNGLCVITQKPPFHECKCYPPFNGPSCKKRESLQIIKTNKLPVNSFSAWVNVNLLIYVLMSVMLASACKPSPCLNGGTCVKGRTRSSFKCECPGNYTGRFCQVGNGVHC